MGPSTEVKRRGELTREDEVLQETKEKESFFWDLVRTLAKGEGGLSEAVAIGGRMQTLPK